MNGCCCRSARATASGRIVNAVIDLELARRPTGVRTCDDIIVTDAD
jgi:hypothetical protein